MPRILVMAPYRSIPVWPLLAAILLATSGCLAPYDQTSDQTITSIQKRLDSHIDAFSATTQPVNSAFFLGLRSDLRALRIRTEARGDDPSLKKQVELVDEISKQVDKAEQLEKTGLRGSQAWQTVKDGIGTNVKGFLTVELARKETGK